MATEGARSGTIGIFSMGLAKGAEEPVTIPGLKAKLLVVKKFAKTAINVFLISCVLLNTY